MGYDRGVQPIVVGSPILSRATVSWRDRTILDLTRRTLVAAGDVADDFGAAVRALQEATELVIPSGRIYRLGEGPAVGSLVSRVGIAVRGRVIVVVRVDEHGHAAVLEPLLR